MTFPELGIIILAGGKSSRMGQDKAFLQLGEDTLIELIVKKAKKFGFIDIIVVTNEKEKYSFLDVLLVSDFYPGFGPLAGIHAGLTYAKHRNNFIMPCDMPFISFDIIHNLVKNQGEHQVVVPKMKDKYQPLVALYTKDCILPIANLLEQKESKVIKLYDLVETLCLEITENNNDFFNINTPYDFSLAKTYLKKE